MAGQLPPRALLISAQMGRQTIQPAATMFVSTEELFPTAIHHQTANMAVRIQTAIRHHLVSMAASIRIVTLTTRNAKGRQHASMIQSNTSSTETRSMLELRESGSRSSTRLKLGRLAMRGRNSSQRSCVPLGRKHL